MSLVLRRPHDMHLFRSCSNVPRLPSFLKLPRNPHVLLPLGKVENPLCLPRKKTVERSKVVRVWCVSNILTWKFASHHSRVRFFDISRPKVFRQRGVLSNLGTLEAGPDRDPPPRSKKVRRKNIIVTSKPASRHSRVQCIFFNGSTSKIFQKCFDNEVFCCAILIWKRASRHSRVHFSKGPPPKVLRQLVCL